MYQYFNNLLRNKKMLYNIREYISLVFLAFQDLIQKRNSPVHCSRKPRVKQPEWMRTIIKSINFGIYIISGQFFNNFISPSMKPGNRAINEHDRSRIFSHMIDWRGGNPRIFHIFIGSSQPFYRSRHLILCQRLSCSC